MESGQSPSQWVKSLLALTSACVVAIAVSACSDEEPVSQEPGEVEAASEDDFKVTRKLRKDWPRTDFTTYSVHLNDFVPAGPRRNEIPPINSPKFRASEPDDKDNLEPVVSVSFNGEAKAYPHSILIWHEVVNDTVGEVPLAVTLSPLTNSTRVFRRVVNGEVTTLGTSGLLRHAGQIFFDDLTESWWQQLTATAVLGTSTGQTIEALPARVEPLASFVARHPDGQILVPNIRGSRPYGRTPYARYDSAKVAVHYKEAYRRPIPPMTRVVVVGEEAWSMDLVAKQGTIETSDLRIAYHKGMNSPFDNPVIRKGRDIGFVTVEGKQDGVWVDVAHDLPFAFGYHAFHPEHPIHQ